MNELLQTRRHFLGQVTTGLAGVSLPGLLQRDLQAAGAIGANASVAPKAKRVLQIFCPGAASHIDLWEHKPELERMSGKPLPGEEGFSSFQGKNGN